MSRFLGVISPQNIDHGLLLDFRALSEDGRIPAGAKRGHRSGWGVVYYEGGEPRYAGRGLGNAFEDYRYVDACRLVKGNGVRPILLAHLGKGPDRDDVANIQPFIHGRLSFAMDGEIGPFEVDLPAGYAPHGTSTAERFFKYIASLVHQLGDPSEALLRAVEQAREAGALTSLTCLLTEGSHLYAYREYTEEETYYSLYAGVRGEAVLVTQEPRWPIEWRGVPQRSLLTVDLDLKIDVREV